MSAMADMRLQVPALGQAAFGPRYQWRIRATVPRHRDESRGLLWIGLKSREITARHWSGAGAGTPAMAWPGSLEVEPTVLRQRLERGLRPGADVLDHLGSGERTQPRAVAIVGAARQSD